MRRFFAVNEDSGQVTLVAPVEQLVSMVGAHSLFTLRFAAIELDALQAAKRRRISDTVRVVNSNHLTSPGWPVEGHDESEIELIDTSNSNQIDRLPRSPIEFSFDEESDAGELISYNQTELERESVYATGSLAGRGVNERLRQSIDRSSIETEISVAFVVLQLTNTAPIFVAPGAPLGDAVNAELWRGQVSELAPIGSKVQFEFELQLQDPDHGLNGTLDVRLEDASGAFQVHPKVVYRNQSIEVVLINADVIKSLVNTNITIKVRFELKFKLNNKNVLTRFPTVSSNSLTKSRR